MSRVDVIDVTCSQKNIKPFHGCPVSLPLGAIPVKITIIKLLGVKICLI